MEAPSEADLSQRLPVKPEPTKVPRERHGRNRRSFMAGRMSMTAPDKGRRPALPAGPASDGLTGLRWRGGTQSATRTTRPSKCLTYLAIARYVSQVAATPRTFQA